MICLIIYRKNGDYYLGPLTPLPPQIRPCKYMTFLIVDIPND